mgnify:CR=1 FL=1
MSTQDLVSEGITDAIAGRLTPGDLVMFLVFMAMLLEPVAMIAGTLGQLQGNLAGFDRVLDEVVRFVEPEGEVSFQWVLART